MYELKDMEIQKYLTPYKYPEPVLTGSGVPGAFDEQAVDVPFVFRHNHQFYMLYTGFDGKGYQSALAVSDDLLHWKHKGIILKRNMESNRWDRIGGAATWIIKENDSFDAVPRLRKIDGNTGWCITPIQEQVMKAVLQKLDLHGVKMRNCWNGIFQMSHVIPGKMEQSGNLADFIRLVSLNMMEHGICFIMRKIKNSAGLNKQA